jgi:4-hydroxybenzoate polyprenyltransferase
MLRIIVGILVALWLIGLLAHIAGGLIYILLVIALIVFIYDMLAGRKVQ